MEKKVWYCSNCGRELPEDTMFCGYCGTKREYSPDNDLKTEGSRDLDEIILKDGICAVCGAKLAVTDSMCSRCGFPVISLTGMDDRTELEEIKKSVREYRNLYFKKERERQERERQEQERLWKERQERERKEQERLDKERQERERQEQERLGKERQERERKEQERLGKERQERERLEKERLEKERQARASGKAVNVVAGTKKKGHSGLLLLLAVLIVCGCFFINHPIDSEDSTSNTETDSTEYFDTSGTLLEAQKYNMDSPAAQTTGTDGQSLADPGALTVEAKELEYKKNEVSLSLEITNTSDQDIYFEDCLAAVNNFMVDSPRFNKERETIPAGETLTAGVTISYSALEPYGIDSIAVVDLAFQIQNGEDRSSMIYTGDVAFKTTLYDSYDASADPYPEAIQNTELQNKYDRTPTYYGEAANYYNEIYNLISQAVYSKEEISTLLLEFSNTSESIAVLSYSSPATNGVILPYTLFLRKLLPGCRGLTAFNVRQQELENYGIDTIDQVSLKVSSDCFQRDSVDITVILNNSSSGYDSSGTEIYNDGSIRMIEKGFHEVEGYAAEALLLIENTGSQTMLLVPSYTEGYFAVNGSSCSGDDFRYGSGSDTLNPGETFAAYIGLNEDNPLNIKGASDIQDFDFTFQIRDAEDVRHILSEPTIHIDNK